MKERILVETIIEQLKDVADIINVKPPNSVSINYLAGYLQEKFESVEHMQKILFFIVNSWFKNSFPKPADFNSVMDAHPVFQARKPDDWEKEYAERLGIEVKKIMVMKIEHYTDVQRNLLGLYTREEAIDFFKNIGIKEIIKSVNDKIKPEKRK